MQTMPSESAEGVLLELTAGHLRCMRGVLHQIQNVDICHQASCFSDFNLHTLLLAAQALLLTCRQQQFPIVGAPPTGRLPFRVMTSNSSHSVPSNSA